MNNQLMKKLMVGLLMIFSSTALFAQVKVGENPTVIHSSAVFELESINKGFLLPRLTTVERNQITSPSQGLIIFNTNTKCIEYFDNNEWVESCGKSTIEPIAANNNRSEGDLLGSILFYIATTGVNLNILPFVPPF